MQMPFLVAGNERAKLAPPERYERVHFKQLVEECLFAVHLEGTATLLDTTGVRDTAFSYSCYFS